MASASLARFHQLAFSEPHISPGSGPAIGSSNHHPLFQRHTNATNVLRPASFPSPAPSPPYAYPTSSYSTNHSYNLHRRKRLYREDSPDSVISHSEHTAYSRPTSRSLSPDSDCCGGLMDCRDLIDRVDKGRDVHDSPTSTVLRSHTRTPA